MKSQFFNGHWTGFEPIPVSDIDIVKHGASASIKDFIAGSFSGTTPVTTGHDNMGNYEVGSLSPTDLEDRNSFNPEIEDVFYHKKQVAAAEAALLAKQQQAAQQAKIAHEQEFAKYKEYFEKSQASSAAFAAQK